jgi:Bacterial transcriptional activator domain
LAKQAEALEQYEKIRVRLAEALGTEPGPEPRQVHADLLAGGSRSAKETETPTCHRNAMGDPPMPAPQVHLELVDAQLAAAPHLSAAIPNPSPVSAGVIWP